MATRGGVLEGVPVASALGDQQAALFGQTCFAPGEGKCTYGTGAFLLVNTGETPVASRNGPADHRRLPGSARQPAVYALEGSIAVAGVAGAVAARQPRPDQRGAARSRPWRRSVPDNGGCSIVPAFSGLFAPHWRPDARGVIAGLTGYVTKAHIARAALEAVAWQTREVVDAMAADLGGGR